MITTSLLNISSDLFMLCIPVPLIIRTRLPLKRKLVLCALFSAGIIVVIIAILNRYYNFTTTNDLVFLGWYNGEAAAAMIISSVPYCWNLLRRVFSLGSWNASKDNGSKTAFAGRGKDGPPTIGGSGAGRIKGHRLVEEVTVDDGFASSEENVS